MERPVVIRAFSFDKSCSARHKAGRFIFRSGGRTLRPQRDKTKKGVSGFRPVDSVNGTQLDFSHPKHDTKMKTARQKAARDRRNQHWV